MDRLARSFKDKKTFIGYFTAGDGGLDYSVACGEALVEGGVDILEIGLPFSDPIADGPVIQRAHQRALDNGATSFTALETARRLRKNNSEIPLVLFSYYNPLLQKGKGFLKEVKDAGFDALLTVDLSIGTSDEDSNSFFHEIKNAGLLPIVLATPSTTEKRIEQIHPFAEGFLYYVSQKGTTGVRSQLADDFAIQMERLKKHFTLPIAAGFGIADRPSANKALEYADGFVVGSAFVKKIEERVDPQELKKLAQQIDPR